MHCLLLLDALYFVVGCIGVFALTRLVWFWSRCIGTWINEKFAMVGLVSAFHMHIYLDILNYNSIIYSPPNENINSDNVIVGLSCRQMVIENGV